jgi:predicted house-cleaning noncanonical NTP pyrophosphatase (MazG superfamily)
LKVKDLKEAVNQLSQRQLEDVKKYIETHYHAELTDLLSTEETE